MCFVLEAIDRKQKTFVDKSEWIKFVTIVHVPLPLKTPRQSKYHPFSPFHSWSFFVWIKNCFIKARSRLSGLYPPRLNACFWPKLIANACMCAYNGENYVTEHTRKNSTLININFIKGERNSNTKKWIVRTNWIDKRIAL